MPVTRTTVFWLSIVTLVGFSLLGWGIIWYFYDHTLLDTFRRGAAWQMQVFYGALYGILAAGCAYALIRHPYLSDVRTFFDDFMARLRLNIPYIIWFSCCAGIGEEILFRAAIQETLGIWPTAVLFILLHGYINPFHLRLTLYGIIMVIVSAGLGYLYEYIGLVAAITAHFVIDVLLFMSVYFKQPHQREQEETDVTPPNTDN